MNHKIKIFFAHKSEHKPLLREIISYLPDYIQTWIDENELCWGEYFENTIETTIKIESDFVIILIDNQSLQSAWVLKELTWSLNKEVETHRTFLLPVIINKIDENILPSILRQKQVLRLLEYDEKSVANLSDRIKDKIVQLILNGISDYCQPNRQYSSLPNAFSKVDNSNNVSISVQKLKSQNSKYYIVIIFTLILIICYLILNSVYNSNSNDKTLQISGVFNSNNIKDTVITGIQSSTGVTSIVNRQQFIRQYFDTTKTKTPIVIIEHINCNTYINSPSSTNNEGLTK